MRKRGLTITAFIVFVLALLNIFLYFNKGNNSYVGIAGMFIKEIKALPLGLNISLIAFVAGWGLLIIIIIVTLLKFLKYQKEDENKEIIYHKIKKKKSKSTTDLDNLYNLLKKEKRLGVSSIAKIFNINKEQALGWAKILENYELAIIEYPAFNEPHIVIKEKIEEGADEKEEIAKNEKENKKPATKKKRTGKKTNIKKFFKKK